MKYLIVTGGVVSGLGKGISISSLGVLLKAHGVRVSAIKIDPYLNSDAGTMSPFEHGEVFVLNDGGEASAARRAVVAWGEGEGRRAAIRVPAASRRGGRDGSAGRRCVLVRALGCGGRGGRGGAPACGASSLRGDTRVALSRSAAARPSALLLARARRRPALPRALELTPHHHPPPPPHTPSPPPNTHTRRRTSTWATTSASWTLRSRATTT